MAGGPATDGGGAAGGSRSANAFPRSTANGSRSPTPGGRIGSTVSGDYSKNAGVNKAAPREVGYSVRPIAHGAGSQSESPTESNNESGRKTDTDERAEQPMNDLFSTLLGAALAVGSGFLGFWLQRRYEGRQQFLAVTAAIRAELDLSPYDSADIFNRSRPRLAHAIQLCRPHISQEQFDRLHAIWRDYRRQNKDDLDPTKVQGLEHSLATERDAHETLSDYLDRLDECVPIGLL